MWVRIVTNGRSLEVDDVKGIEGIKAGVYTRLTRHERAVRERRETADV